MSKNKKNTKATTPKAQTQNQQAQTQATTTPKAQQAQTQATTIPATAPSKAQNQQNQQATNPQATTTPTQQATAPSKAQIIINDLLAGKDNLLANLRDPENLELSSEEISMRFQKDLEDVGYSDFSVDEKSDLRKAFLELEKYCMPALTPEQRKFARAFFQITEDALDTQDSQPAKNTFFFTGKNTNQQLDPVIMDLYQQDQVAKTIYSAVQDIQDKFGIDGSTDPNSIDGLSQLIEKAVKKGLGSKLKNLEKLSPDQSRVYEHTLDCVIKYCEDHAENEFCKGCIRLFFDPVKKSLARSAEPAEPVSAIPVSTPKATQNPKAQQARVQATQNQQQTATTTTTTAESVYPLIDDENFGLPEIFYPYINVWNFVRIALIDEAIVALCAIKAQTPERKVANALVWVMKQMEIDPLTRKAFINAVVERKVFGDKISREISITV